MPSSPPSVRTPAGFVPTHAIAFGSADAAAIPVDPANPLPTRAMLVQAASAALVGTTSASTTAGPFVPDLGRAIWIGLAGVWSGTVQLLRSLDGGATRAPLTIGGQGWASFAANCNEPVAEESVAGATYYLAITLTTGSVAYRVTQ